MSAAGTARWLVALAVASILSASVANEEWQALPWPEADALFHQDPHWAGGDGGYSIPLGYDRVLWLFGDSFIDPEGRGRRQGPGVRMISNTLAIQQGLDPARATLAFHWREDGDGLPAAFFPDVGDERHWPGHGIRLGDRLLLFLMAVTAVDTGLGFEVRQARALMVDNPDESPALWRWQPIPLPDLDRSIILGSGGVAMDDNDLYAHGSVEPGGQSAHLVRWPLSEARAGRLSRPRWWTPAGWAEEPAPEPTLTGAGTEFTLHPDSGTGEWWLIHTRGFGPADVMIRRAPAPQGPWSEPTRLYRPPENDRADIMIYQGKAHPHLTGADLVLSYCSNVTTWATLTSDRSVYYPRFIRIQRP